MDVRERREYTIVRTRFDDLFGKMMISRGYSTAELYYGHNSVILRSLRRIWDKLNLPFYEIWFNKKAINISKKIVVFEPLCSPKYLKWLKKVNPEAEICCWYWNYAKNTMNPNDIDENWCTKWSFSRVDCLDYGMRFNPPPYFSEITKPKENAKYDVVFVGKDKGRLSFLMKFREQLTRLGISSNFVISPTSKKTHNKLYSPEVSYEESIRLSAEGKAVLDYIEVNNSGQSMRMMQALFLNEKIITNSVLITDYDFYNKNNIFIIEQDDINEISEFINTPYLNIEESVKYQYDFDSFIERFFLDKRTFADEMLDMIDRAQRGKYD